MTDDLWAMVEKDGAPQTLTPELIDSWNVAAQWIDLDPGFGWNVPRVTRSDAVGLGLAIQCAAVKARDIAKADMVLWREIGRSWEEVKPREHWFAKLLRRKPNQYQSWTDFWRMTVMHLELAQNAYIFPLITRLGEVRELVPIMPARCRERISPDGRLFYEIHAGTEFERAQLGDTHIIVPADRIIHLRGKLLDGMHGVSSLQLGNPVFALLGAISQYQTVLFGNEGKAPLVFETDQAFTGDMADVAFRRLKDQLSERTKKAARSGDPILLEAGLKAKPIATNPRDALTTEAYNQQVERICGLMETPPHKIFHYNSVKYDNQSAANAQYANDCLIPIAKNIEEKLRLQLLGEDEIDDHWPEFDRMALLAGDPATLMGILDKALKGGAVEINEVRDRLPLGLNPIEGGDVRYVPVNMAIVDRAGNIVHQAATGQPQPGGNEPDQDDEDAGSKGLRLAVNNA